MLARLAIAIVFTLPITAPAIAEDIVGRARVIDGDTVDVGSVRVQLADDLEVSPWTAQSLGLVTAEVRAAWERRLKTDPLPAPRHKDLFAWADRDKPPPAELDDADLDRLIQQHPDMVYVEALRTERRARAENSAQA